MNISEFRRSGRLQLVMALIVLVAGYIFLHRIISGISVIFDGDEFNHAAPALDFLIYFKEGQWTELIQRIRKEAFYPPLFPILLSPVYYLFGVSDVVARSFSLFLYFSAIVVSAFATYKITSRELKDRRAGNLAASTVILLGITAPYPILNSTICMVESLGILLMASLILIVFGNGEKPDSTKSAAIIALMGALLFFTKYTFIILLIPGLLLAILSCARDATSLKSAFKTCFIVGLAIIAVAFSWYLIADRAQINYFLFDYPLRGYTFGLKSLLFYPKILINKAFYHASVGLLFLLLIIWSLRSSWNNLWFRASVLIIVISVQCFAVIYERQLRHIIPIIPFIWLICGYALAALCYSDSSIKKAFKECLNYLAPKTTLGQPINQNSQKLDSSSPDIRSFILIPIFLIVVTVSVANSKKIQQTMIEFMEYHPIVNSAITNITKTIKPCCNYTVGSFEFSEWFYYLDWYAAKQEMITLNKARQKRKTNPSSKKLPSQE